MSQTFTLDMQHLQKVQRTLRKAGNIFPNEKELIATLETEILKVQDEHSFNTYYHMANYLKQRLKELGEHLETPQPGIDEALSDLTWSLQYLKWLVSEAHEGDH